MRTASALLRQAGGYSHTLQCWADFYQNGALVWEKAPVSTGKISSDRSNAPRSDCSLTVAIPEWEPLRIDNKAGRVRVYRGVSTLGYREVLQLGEFRVDDIERSALGAVSIKASGLESYVIDARFLQPRMPARGASTIDQIMLLVREALPAAQFKRRNTQDRRVTAIAAYDRERMDAVDALAASISAEVFVDATGSWVIADMPNPLTGAPVFIVDEGVGGVLVDRSTEDTRDRVYNAASVRGGSADMNTTPAWAWSADLNPASPTYFYGPFGQKPIFHTSQFFSNSGQCQAYADKLLVEALAENVTLSFDTVPLDFLEVGDLLAVRDGNGDLETLLLQSYDVDLGVTGRMACKTLSSKVVIADGV